MSTQQEVRYAVTDMRVQLNKIETQASLLDRGDSISLGHSYRVLQDRSNQLADMAIVLAGMISTGGTWAENLVQHGDTVFRSMTAEDPVQ